MNDYNNMNYFMPNMPNDFSYLNGMQNVNNWGQNTNMMKPNKPNTNGEIKGIIFFTTLFKSLSPSPLNLL